MDGAQFDRLSRLIARTSTRRSALTLAAALGLGVSQTEAGKKRKNTCQGGCGPCKVCKKKGNTKKCVTAPDGTACDEGTCQAGACTCVPATCESLGNVCGTQNNGCGGMVTCTCGLGSTPACDGGQCTNCATSCPAPCRFCLTRPDGTTRCGSADSTATCDTPCLSDGDCPIDRPFCVIAFTNRQTGQSFSINSAAFCGPLMPRVCAAIPAC